MSPHPNAEIAPWQERTGQMYLTDHELLEALRDVEHATPKGLANGRRRENVVRLQCRYLAKIGLVTPIAHDAYELTAEGRAYTPGSSEYPSTNEFFHLTELLDLPDRRITDVSAVDPAMMKIVNEDFYHDHQNEYGGGTWGSKPNETADLEREGVATHATHA